MAKLGAASRNIGHWILVGFALLAALDVVMVLVVPVYRESMGTLEIWSLALVARIFPPVFLLGFYLLLWNKRRASSRHVLLFVHSILFIFLGLVLCLPWIGPLLTFVTPVSPLYMGAILWAPGGYYFAILSAVMFILANIVLLLLSITKNI